MFWGLLLNSDTSSLLSKLTSVRYKNVTPTKVGVHSIKLVDPRFRGGDNDHSNALCRTHVKLTSLRGARRRRSNRIVDGWDCFGLRASPACHLPALAAPWCRPGAATGAGAMTQDPRLKRNLFAHLFLRRLVVHPGLTVGRKSQGIVLMGSQEFHPLSGRSREKDIRILINPVMRQIDFARIHFFG